MLLTLLALVTLPVASLAAPNYNLNWYVVDGGGDDAAVSASFKMGISAAQPAAGEAVSPSFRLKMGFWYGADLCRCPFQSDFDEDGFLTALDLSAMIDILFAGQPDVKDPVCPSPRADFDCDGFSTALDLGGLIDHLFAGGDPPCDPCAP
jgi:hypothetical protein